MVQIQPGPLLNCPCSSAVEHSLGKGEVSGSSPDEGTLGIAWYQRDYHYRLKKFIRSGRPITGPLFCFKGKYLKVHHTYDDTEMATIRRSGSGWQALIRRKNYVGQRSRTFLSRDLAESWADAVEDRTRRIFPDIPVTLGDAINDYINCLLYTSPSPRDRQKSRMPSSA